MKTTPRIYTFRGRDAQPVVVISSPFDQFSEMSLPPIPKKTVKHREADTVKKTAANCGEIPTVISSI